MPHPAYSFVLVLVLAAYAGPETKLSLNQREPPFKISSLDKRCVTRASL
jgi:hypothetical protein